VRKVIIPIFAKDKVSCSLYFESFIDIDFLVLHFGKSLDYYIKEQNNPYSLVFALSLKLWKEILLDNPSNCKVLYQKLESFRIDPKPNNFFFNYFIFVQIFYLNYMDGCISDDFIKKLIELENEIYEFEISDQQTNMSFHSMMMDALSFFGYHNEGLFFAQRILDHPTALETIKNTRYYNQFNLYYSDLLLQSGNKTMAEKLFSNVDEQNLQGSSMYYLTIKYYFVKAKFYKYDGNREDAINSLRKIISISKYLSFELFIKMAERETKQLSS
jgi:hypothetical protein